MEAVIGSGYGGGDGDETGGGPSRTSLRIVSNEPPCAWSDAVVPNRSRLTATTTKTARKAQATLHGITAMTHSRDHCRRRKEFQKRGEY